MAQSFLVVDFRQPFPQVTPLTFIHTEITPDDILKRSDIHPDRALVTFETTDRRLKPLRRLVYLFPKTEKEELLPPTHRQRVQAFLLQCALGQCHCLLNDFKQLHQECQGDLVAQNAVHYGYWQVAFDLGVSNGVIKQVCEEHPQLLQAEYSDSPYGRSLKKIITQIQQTNRELEESDERLNRLNEQLDQMRGFGGGGGGLPNRGMRLPFPPV